MELNEEAIKEAVTELYEDLSVRVGRELHAVIKGFYSAKKAAPRPPSAKGKKSASPSPIPTASTTPSSTPSPSSKDDWNISPWRPKTATKKKKKKKATIVVPRRPFGPKGTVFAAGEEGDLQYIELLLSPWGSAAAINWCDPANQCMPPIILAASLGKEKIVATLISHSASVTSRTNTGNTALHKAAKAGHMPVVLLLLKEGSEVDATNTYGNTPLSSAVRNGHPEICEILVMVGAKVELKNNNGETPLDRTTNVELKSLLTTRRNRFLQLSEKRIAKKRELLVTQQILQKQKEEQLQRQREKEREERGDQITPDIEDEQSDSADGSSDKIEDAVLVVEDTVPVLSIIADFQQILIKREKARQANANKTRRGGSALAKSSENNNLRGMVSK